jgi:hypothetical protein
MDQPIPTRSHHLQLLQQPVVSISVLCQLATTTSKHLQESAAPRTQQQQGDLGLFPLLALRCVEVLPDMTPAQAAHLAQAFATAGHYNQEVFQGICQVVTQALVSSDHHLAVAAPPWGTPSAAAESAPKETTPPSQLTSTPAAAGAAAEAAAEGVTPQQLVGVAAACRHLRHHDLAFLEALAAAALRGGHLLSLEHWVQVSAGVDDCVHT